MSEVTWNGRIYVDEPSITPEDYKEFFSPGYFVIGFATTNAILKQRQDGYLEEVVPADELNDEARQMIKDQALEGNTSGEIELYGRYLHWDWEYEIIRDGKEIEWTDLEDYEQEKILEDMLDNECRCGMW